MNTMLINWLHKLPCSVFCLFLSITTTLFSGWCWTTGHLNMRKVSEETKVEGDVGASGLDGVTVGGGG